MPKKQLCPLNWVLVYPTTCWMGFHIKIHETSTWVFWWAIRRHVYIALWTRRHVYIALWTDTALIASGVENQRIITMYDTVSLSTRFRLWVSFYCSSVEYLPIKLSAFNIPFALFQRCCMAQNLQIELGAFDNSFTLSSTALYGHTAPTWCTTQWSFAHQHDIHHAANTTSISLLLFLCRVKVTATSWTCSGTLAMTPQNSVLLPPLGLYGLD